MRALNVAGVLIFINFAIAFINAMNLFPGTSIGEHMSPDIVGTLETFFPKTDDKASYALLSLMLYVGFFIQSILFFVVVLGNITILLPFFLTDTLHLPVEVTLPITAGVWLVYLIDYNEYRARMKTLSG